MSERRKIYVVLLHSPMTDRTGKEVTTAVTNLDIHDISRTCKTYGVSKYFIVNPEAEQERLVNVILGHWREEVSKVYHPSRAKALSIARFVRTFEEAFNDVSLEAGQRPFVVMPDARDLSKYFDEIWSYEDLRERMNAGQIPEDKSGTRPVMIVFGTGWGIAPSFYGQVDRPLKPLRREKFLEEQDGGYNHLSVRAAAAIIMDRLFGERG